MTLQCKLFLTGLLFIFTLPFLLQTAPASADTLYSANNNGSISVIDTSNDSLTDTIALPFSSKPTAICLNSVSPHAYTLNSGDNTVSIVDTKSKAVVSTITDTRFTGLTSLACDPTGTHVLIGNNDPALDTSNILYLNTSTLALENQETAVGKNPGSIVFNRNGSKAYILSQGVPSVSVLDTATMQLTGSPLVLSEFDYPFSLAIHTNDTYLYVVNLIGSVTFINPATMEALPTPLIVGDFPNAITVSNKTNTLYVSDFLGTVSLVNPVSQSIFSSFSSESLIALIERNDGQRIYVASDSDDLIRSYDAGSLTTPPTTIPLPNTSSPQAFATLLGTRQNLDLTITGSGTGNVNWPFNVAYPLSTTGTVGIPEGIGVTVKASADYCSTVAWNGCDSASGGGTGSSLCQLGPIAVGKSVNAIFTKKVNHAVVTSVPGGNGSVSCQTPVCDGGNSVCSITPDTGYTITSLKDNGSDILGSVTGGATFQIQNIVNEQLIAAEFTLKTFKVTASADANGSISPSIDQTVSYGNPVSFTLIPNANFSLVSVNGCGGTLSLNDNIYTTEPITRDCTVSASFTPSTYTVTSQVVSGGGTITCQTSVISGGTATCSVIPNAGFHLESLNDNGFDNKSVVSGTSYQIANVTEHHDIVALFTNSPPTATSQSVTTPENQARSVILAGIDPEGSSLTFGVASSPVHGTLSGDASSLIYTPVTGYVGTDSFTFTASDGPNTSAEAAVTIIITQVKQRVSFAAGAAGTITDSSGTITDTTQQDVNLYGITTPVTANANQGYHFTSWTGSGNFISTSNPLIVGNVTSDMTITANFANSAPTANSQSVTTPENQATVITLTGSDPESSSLELAFTTAVPTNGTLSGTAPNLIYTPNIGYDGPDSFTFTVSDGVNTSADATVNITVEQVTRTVSFAAGANGTISGTSPQIVPWDGNTATVTATADSGYQFVDWTDNGVFVSNSPALSVSNVTADMTITANFTAAPVTGACGTDSVTDLAAIAPTNLCSVGSASAISGIGHPWIWECYGLNGGTTAPCSATIRQVIVTFDTSPADGGNIIGNATQSLDYGASTVALTATANTDKYFEKWTGTAGFITTSTNPLTVANVIADMTITANFSTVPVSGVCGNDNGQILAALAPTNLCSAGIASAISGSGHPDDPWRWSCDGIGSPSNNADCSASIRSYNISFTDPLANGTISSSATQQSYYGTPTAAVTATADPGYHFVNWTGTAGFVATSNNPLIVSFVTADMTLTANFANSAPVATTLNLTTPENQARTIILAGSDQELGSLELAYAVGSPANGTLSGTAPNLTYTPSTGYVGTDSFTYTVSDGVNISAGAKVSITVVQVTQLVSFTAGANGSISGSSTQSINWNGSTGLVVATPKPGYHFVNWTDKGVIISTTSRLTVTNVTADMDITANFANSAPTANSQSVTTPENQAVAVTLTGRDPEVSSLALSYSFEPPANGSLSGNAPALIYTPNAGFAGTDSFTFTVSDGVNTSAGATVSIAVTSYTVTLLSTINGTISPSTAQDVHYGATASFELTPDTGYSIASPSGCGGTLTGSTYTTAAIVGNCSISVTFIKSTYLTTSSIPGGNGTLSCTPTVADYGTSVSCTIVPANGYELSRLIDNATDVPVTANANSHTITNITANHALSATFSLKSYTVTVVSGAYGSTVPKPAQIVTHGNPASFKLVPDTGYHIGTIVGDTCSGTLSGTTYTTGQITADCTIAADFVLNQYSLNGTAGAGGIINPAAAQNAGYGSAASFTVTPDKGYHLATLTDNGVSVLPLVTNNNTYTLNSISSSHNIAAEFTAYSLSDALQALRYAVRIELPKPDEHLWLDVAPLDSGKPKGNGVIDIMDALVLLKQSIGSYTAW